MQIQNSPSFQPLSSPTEVIKSPPDKLGDSSSYFEKQQNYKWKGVPRLTIFYTSFYDHLFEICPETCSIFNQNMKKQGQALVGMIGSLVKVLAMIDMWSVKHVLSALAARHNAMGVTPAMYTAVGFRECSGDEFAEEVKETWLQLYAYLMSIILPVVLKNHSVEQVRKYTHQIPMLQRKHLVAINTIIAQIIIRRKIQL